MLTASQVGNLGPFCQKPAFLGPRRFIGVTASYKIENMFGKLDD